MSEAVETVKVEDTTTEGPVGEPEKKISEKKVNSSCAGEAKEERSKAESGTGNKVRIKPSDVSSKKESSKKKRAASQNGYEELIKAGTIKRIMKIDKNVKMTGSEAVYLVSKATELFLGKIMNKAISCHSTNPQAKSIHYNDVARTVRENPEMDFLVDLLPEV